MEDEFDIDGLVVEEEGIKRKASDTEQSTVKKTKNDMEKGNLRKAQNKGRRVRKNKIEKGKKMWPSEGKNLSCQRNV